MASAFDGARQLALVFGADTGLATRTDLAFISDETTKNFDLLVINPGILVGAEWTFPWSSEKSATSGLIFFSIWLVAQLLNSLLAEYRQLNFALIVMEKGSRYLLRIRGSLGMSHGDHPT